MIYIINLIDRWMPWHPLNRGFLQILGAALCVAVCGLIRGSIELEILPVLFFVPGVIFASILFGRFAGAVSVIMSALAAVFFFFRPYHSFLLQTKEQGYSVLLFVVITLGISFVSAQLRRSMLAQAELNRTLEARIEAAIKENSEVNEALRQSQKMEAVGQLTGGIAHDFNNILMGIQGSLDLIKRGIERGTLERTPKYIETAEQATKRAADLTHRLLAFSRKQTLKPIRIDANELVQSMVDMLRRTLGPSFLILVEPFPRPLFASVDRTQLESALLNLAINARDAMPGGGPITIQIRETSVDDRKDLELAPGGYLTIAVTDTGTGIPPEIVARVFEPFFTTKEQGKGTGLGLSMVQGFARQSGGQVRCVSKVGRGTTMSILLPSV